MDEWIFFATLFVSFCNATFWWYSFLLLPQSMKEKDILRNAFAVPLLPLAELIQPSCCAYRACSFPPMVLPPHRLRVKVQDDAGSACDVWFCSAMVAIAFFKIRTIIDTVVTALRIRTKPGYKGELIAFFKPYHVFGKCTRFGVKNLGSSVTIQTQCRLVRVPFNLFKVS